MPPEYIEVRTQQIMGHDAGYQVLYIARGQEIILPDQQGNTVWYIEETDHVMAVANGWAHWFAPRRAVVTYCFTLNVYLDGEQWKSI